MTTAIQKIGGGYAIAPANMGELWTFCERLAESDFVPKDFRGKPGNCMVAVQMGGELGLSPMQAIQNIAVINGRPSVWGDAMKALCMTHPDYVDTIETYDPVTRSCTCIAQRRGRKDVVETFSWDDAVKAKLDVKDTYKQYEKRMLKMRARGFALRDQWTDVLKGLISAEEAQDYPKEVRAEVVSSKTVDEPKPEPKQERKSTPPPAAAVPLISKLFPNTNYADKPLADAPFEILEDYRVWLEALLKDDRRARMHKAAQLSLNSLTAEVDRRIEREAAKQTLPPAESDPVAEKLQQEIDNRHADNDAKQQHDDNTAWGMENPS